MLDDLSGRNTISESLRPAAGRYGRGRRSDRQCIYDNVEKHSEDEVRQAEQIRKRQSTCDADNECNKI